LTEYSYCAHAELGAILTSPPLQLSEHSLVELVVVRAKATGHHPLQPAGMLEHVLQRYARRGALGVGKDSRTDGGKSDRLHTALFGKLERAPIATFQQRGLPLVSAAPNRTHCVYHPTGGQSEPRGKSGLSGRTPAESTTVFEQLRSRRAVNRPVHTSATQQTGVSRIDDCINLQNCNISLNDLEHGQPPDLAQPSTTINIYNMSVSVKPHSFARSNRRKTVR